MKKILVLIAIALPLLLASCGGDEVIYVKIIDVTRPHTEGSGLGTTWYSAATTVESVDTKERRRIEGSEWGQIGEIIGISRSRWRGW